ncbi:hypothetical protein [Providencia sp.]|uniref:hypothetical protein n=1 Tax=Providencia sp. TaxID=589 RepID=UPI003F94CB64
MKNIAIKKHNIITLLVILSFYAYLSKMITGSDAFLAISVFIAIIVIPIFVVTSKDKVNIFYLSMMVLSILVVILSSFFSRSYDEISAFVGIIYVATSCSLCWAINESGKELFIARMCFYAFFIYTLPFFIINNIVNPDGYNDILAGASRNIVSAIFILLSCFHMAAYIKENNKYPILVQLISFICCFMLFGRSGILISFIILSISLVNSFKKTTSFTIILIIGAALAYFIYDIQDYVMTKTNFALGTDSPRSMMLDQYFSNMDLRSLLFGNEYLSCCNEIVRFENNPHNSFIMGHARYGIFHTLIIASLLAYTVIRARLIAVILFIIALTRYAVDQIGLFSPMDFTLLYLAFCMKK